MACSQLGKTEIERSLAAFAIGNLYHQDAQSLAAEGGPVCTIRTDAPWRYEVVPAFEDESFGRIIHDPPTFSLAGDLYSGVFYRILKRGGRLGDPNSKASGGVTRGVLRRLQEVGFT